MLYFTGIPTHVYQFGASILATGPAILLAQLTALFVVLPVFGKNSPEVSSSQEMMLVAQQSASSTSKPKHHLTTMSYISRRFSSNSIKVLVTTLVVTLWTLLAVSTIKKCKIAQKKSLSATPQCLKISLKGLILLNRESNSISKERITKQGK